MDIREHEPLGLSNIAREIRRNGSRILAQKVEQLKKQGKEVLHLTSAPVERPGDNVIEAAIEAVQSKKRSSSRGFPEFREAVARKMLRENGISCDPETDILPTNGSMHAIMVSLAGCINPGDEVLLLAPCFYFSGAVQLAGGVCRYVQLDAAENYRIDPDRIEQSITKNTRAIIWNTPVNPTGYVATEEDTRGIADLALKHDLTIIADETYEKWVFNKKRHISIGSYPEVRNRVITVHSFSKNYSMARWRVGYLVAPGNKVASLQKILEHSLLECNSIAQGAAAAALSGPQAWVERLADKIRKQRDMVCDGLGPLPQVSFPVPEGGPNAYIDITRLTDSSQYFSDHVLENYGIPVVPGEAFMHPGCVRFCFAGDEDPLKEGIQRFQTAVETFPKS